MGIGCGVSTIPQNVRPHLHQRLYKMKKRLQPGGQINPYKKGLLDKDGDEEGSSHQPILSRENSSISFVEERISCVTAEGSKGCLIHVRNDSFFSTTNNEGVENIEEDDEGVENIEEDHDENERTSFDERMIRRHDDYDDSPGSPSFRVYCSENDKNRKRFDEKFCPDNFVLENEKDFQALGLIEEETQSEEEEETQVHQYTQVEPKTVKRGRRRSCFRKVLPSGGHIKNLCSPKAGRPRSLTEKQHADQAKTT